MGELGLPHLRLRTSTSRWPPFGAQEESDHAVGHCSPSHSSCGQRVLRSGSSPSWRLRVHQRFPPSPSSDTWAGRSRQWLDCCRCRCLRCATRRAGTQSIEIARNVGTLNLPEGSVVAWSETLCQHALPSGLTTVDATTRFPGSSAVAHLGVNSYAGCPSAPTTVASTGRCVGRAPNGCRSHRRTSSS